MRSTLRSSLTQRIFTQKIVAIALALIFPATAFSSENAVLFPHGNVNVNGKALAGTSTLFAGDQVSTGADGSVVLTAHGSSVQLASSSSMSYGSDGVAVANGGVTVSTSTGLASHTLGITVEPAAQQAARYILVHRDGNIGIAALQGALRISDGRQEMTLASGKAYMMDDSAGHSEAPRKDKEGGVIGNGGGAAGHSAFGNGHYVLIFAVTSALAAIAAYTLTNQVREQASPVCPNGRAVSGTCI